MIGALLISFVAFFHIQLQKDNASEAFAGEAAQGIWRLTNLASLYICMGSLSLKRPGFLISWTLAVPAYIDLHIYLHIDLLLKEEAPCSWTLVSGVYETCGRKNELQLATGKSGWRTYNV